MRIASAARAFPPHYYDQEELLAAFRQYWTGRTPSPELLERLHRNSRVRGRHLALPLERYLELDGWGQHNDAWIEIGQQVGEEAVREALGRAGVDRADVGSLIFVTTTGVATPSLDARLMNRLGLPPQVRRLPLFGLGCAGGTAGIARAAEMARSDPERAVVLLSVELCSLTVQRDDLSVANLISTGLFGDGAAAVVMTGSRNGSGPEVVASRSVFYPGTERTMGWDVSEEGLKVVLSASLPDLIRANLRRDVDAFLGGQGMSRETIAAWICHPGGPKVLEAVQESLDIPPQSVEISWRSLAEVGNLSSASVLLVLEETLAGAPGPGEHGLVLALGPGFALEMVLLRW